VGINCELARKFDPAASQPRARLRHSAACPEIGEKKREHYGDGLLALVKAVEG